MKNIIKRIKSIKDLKEKDENIIVTKKIYSDTWMNNITFFVGLIVSSILFSYLSYKMYKNETF